MVSENTKNLPTNIKIKKSAKSEKPNLNKSKKPDLAKRSNFVKTNIFNTDFLIPNAKKSFYPLMKDIYQSTYSSLFWAERIHLD